MRPATRRAYLSAIGTVAIAGCLGSAPAEEPTAEAETDSSASDGDDVATTGGQTGPPTADRTLPLPDTTSSLADGIVSGGVAQDGIPSIDDPQFIDAPDAETWLDDGEPVFGVDVHGEVKAYPQRVLVWHEVVNDVIGGENLAVTYCPLTGTAQGFERGPTEFGVSGRLLNSNLIMYDRASESYWPQMLATAVRGEHEGEVLREFPVTWTTWERWSDTHPETTVLSDETGYARDYADDPYGSYDPTAGFYADDSLIFSPYAPVDESVLHPKEVVLGARSADGAIAVHKESLASAGVLEGAVDGVPYVAVYDPELDTGYVYRDPNDVGLTYHDGRVTVDGESHRPSGLPLERVLRYDAFWFAWAGYYPETELLR